MSRRWATCFVGSRGRTLWLLTCVGLVLAARTAYSAEPDTDVEFFRGGARQELSSQACSYVADQLPKLFATCSINSRDDPQIFGSWGLATIWEETRAKDHLVLQLASPIEIRAGRHAVTVQHFLMGLDSPFPGPELSRHGEQVVAYIKCSGISVMRFVCAPDLRPSMPDSYDELCSHLERLRREGLLSSR